MKQYICKQCTKEFESARITRAPKFCSFECRDQSYTKIKSFKCEQCAIEVSANSRSIKDNRKFCSQSCANEWKKVAYCGKKIEYIKVNCKECNKELERQPSKIYTKNVFCDKTCKGKWIAENILINVKSKMHREAFTSKGKIIFRSRWEIAFVKDYLDLNNLQWQYEPKTFTLSNGQKYTPDFYMKDLNQWVEIKGSDKRKQKNRYKADLFSKDFPNEKILFLTEIELKRDYKINLSHVYLNSLCSDQGEGRQTQEVGS